MKTIEIQDIKFSIPESYNELSLLQLKHVCKLHADNSPFNQINVLWYLLGLKWWKITDYKKWNVIRMLPSEWIHTLLTDVGIFGWINKKANLTDYKLSTIRIGKTKLYGPSNNILNISAVEVTFCYDFFKKYADTKNVRYLDLLIGVLFREKDINWRKNINNYGYNGDKRVPLNPFLLDKRLKLISTLNVETKVLIFLMFSSKWSEFESKKEYSIIFPTGSEESQPVKQDPLIWQKIMMKIAESGAFGDMAMVEKIPMDRFFLYMVKNMEEYLEMKDKLKK